MILESVSLKEENIIKNIKTLFRLKKEPNYTAIKDTRNLFRQKKKLKQLIFLSMKKKKIIINQ